MMKNERVVTSVAQAISSADNQHWHLEELVLASSHLEIGRSNNNELLTALLELSTLARLKYLYLAGFRIDYDTLMEFLKRHRSSLEQHWYNDLWSVNGQSFVYGELHEAFQQDLIQIDLPAASSNDAWLFATVDDDISAQTSVE